MPGLKETHWQRWRFCGGWGGEGRERQREDLNFCVRGSLPQGKNCDDGGEGEATAAAVLGSTWDGAVPSLILFAKFPFYHQEMQNKSRHENNSKPRQSSRKRAKRKHHYPVFIPLTNQAADQILPFPQRRSFSLFLGDRPDHLQFPSAVTGDTVPHWQSISSCFPTPNPLFYEGAGGWGGGRGC